MFCRQAGVTPAQVSVSHAPDIACCTERIGIISQSCSLKRTQEGSEDEWTEPAARPSTVSAPKYMLLLDSAQTPVNVESNIEPDALASHVRRSEVGHQFALLQGPR